jgi:hypothetical protein
VRVPRKVPLVLGIATVFPASPDGCNNRDDHTKTHGDTEADFLYPSHIQAPRNKPRERGEDKIHDDVVDWRYVSSYMKRSGFSHRLTISTFLEIVSELPGDAEVQSVPDIVALLITYLGPLEDDFGYHVGVHRYNTEPDDPFVPSVGELQQSCRKRCLTQSLADESTTRRYVDKNLHPIIPFVDDITSCVLDGYNNVVGCEDDLVAC